MGDVRTERPYDLVSTPEGVVARVRLRGSSVLVSSMLNRGTAFTRAERQALGLTGLLPEGVSTIEGQLRRVYGQYQRQPDDLAKNLYLAGLRDRNEVLFYRLLTEHISEMLPIVYTPTIGTAIERYSYEFGRARAVFMSARHPAPVAQLHGEDFGAGNAHRILTKYAGSCLTFNDDIQGTAAVVLAAALGAVRAAGSQMRDQRVVIHGAGTAGIGIADVLRQVMISEGLSPGETIRWFYALGSKGLLTSDYPGTLRAFQVPYARPAAEVSGWPRDGEGRIGLAEVVARSRPTMLIRTSTQPGAATDAIVTEMAAHVERPIIMPLSNPTSHSEARPADLIAWTQGRALIATGSPFEPVPYRGVSYQIAQAHNALIFPGLGLGVTVCRARRVSDAMLAAASQALSDLSEASTPGAPVLPPITRLRAV